MKWWSDVHTIHRAMTTIAAGRVLAATVGVGSLGACAAQTWQRHDITSACAQFAFALVLLFTIVGPWFLDMRKDTLTLRLLEAENERLQAEHDELLHRGTNL